MKNLFKRGNGYQSTNKRVATALVREQILAGNLPATVNDNVMVSTMDDGRLMVLNANDNGLTVEGPAAGQFVVVSQDKRDGRVLMMVVRDYDTCREIARVNKRAFVTHSELLSQMVSYKVIK